MDKNVARFLGSLEKQGLTKDQIARLAQKQNMPEAWKIDHAEYLKRNKAKKQEKQAKGAAAHFSTDAVKRRRAADSNKDDNSFGNPGFAGSVGRAITAPFRSRGPSPEQKAAAEAAARRRRRSQ